MRNQEQGSTSQDHSYLKPKSKNPVLITEERKVELFARIKKSSGYYHQGLDQSGKPGIFKIDGIRHGFLSFRLNCNNYSHHDLAFYVKDIKGSLIPKNSPLPGQIPMLREKWQHLSEFMKEIKQSFSRFYNKKHHRRGFFWSERFI